MTGKKKNTFYLAIVLGVVGLAAVAIGFYMNSTAPATTADDIAYGDLSANQIQQLLQAQNNNPDLVVLDVRTPEEFSEAHINPNGVPLINLDFYASNFGEELTALDKSKSYVIYCRSGNRSSQTVALLKGMGFDNFYHLEGGIQAWQNANLPTL